MHPDELLKQIRALLDQYLAMGDQTPVAPEAQALAQSIDSQMGTAGPAQGSPLDQLMSNDQPGSVPPDAGAEPVVPPENQPGGDMAEPPPNQGAKTYGEANVSAIDRLKKRNAKSKA
jgi:hypothetical protein